MTTARIRIRRNTAAFWTSDNPTPGLGEIVFETDTRKIKVGDGSTAWTSLDYITAPGSVAWGAVTGTLADQTDLQSALDLKAAISSLATVATSGAYGDLTGLPTLGTAAAAATGDFEPAGAIASHAGTTTGVHGISAFGATLVDDADAAAARTTLGAAATSHTHPATDIVSGTVNTARLGSGTASASNFLRGDQTWSAPPNQSMTQIATAMPVVTNYTAGAHLAEYLTNIDIALGLRLLASDVSAFGLTLIDDADAAAARTTLGLGTAATGNTGDFAAASHNHAATEINSGTLDPARLPAIATEIGELRCTIDGGGAVVTATTIETVIERDCTLHAATLHADQSGSITCAVKRDRGGSETTLGTITLSAAQTNRVTDLSGWTATDLQAGDILIVEWSSPTTVERVVLTLGRVAA